MPDATTAQKNLNPHLDEDAVFEWGAAAGRDAHERRMKKYFGLRRHPNYKLAHCPRVVIGKRCLMPHRCCICQQSQIPHYVMDHTNLWRDAFNQTVLTLEPYGINAEDFELFTRQVVALGLEVQVEGYSPYYPGHTVLVIIRRPRPGI